MTEGTVKLPLAGKVKKPAAIAGVVAIGVAAVIWWRQRQTAAAAPATSTADQQPGLSDLGAGGYPGFGFYGPNGSVGTVPPGPGAFVDNAEWAQYAVQYLTQNTGASGAAVSAALGPYLEAVPLNPEQIQVVEEAIAFAGYPPVAGPHGDPPGFRTAHQPPPHHGPKTEKVPDVKGKNYEEASHILAAHHLRARRAVPDVGIVGDQKPEPGTEVKRASTVTLYPRPHHRGPETEKVPDVKGKKYEEAARILAAHHLRAHRGVPDVGIVGSQAPDAGDQVKRGSTVTLYPQHHRSGGK